MDVAAYIKELLSQERFVYVPGLGTFLTRKTAGVYNAQQQQFYPPKNSIDFVPEEKQDEILENYISRQKNISTEAAKYFIEKFVGQVKFDAINKNLPVKEVLFPAENEAASATADKKATLVFNQENFGLPPVTLPVIKKEPEPVEKEAVSKKDYVENFYREFSNNLPEEPEEVKPKKSTAFWASILLLLAVCILGCYALYLYYPDLYSHFKPNKTSEITIIKKPVAADTAQQTQDTAKQTIQQDTNLTTTAADTLVAAKKTVTEFSKPVTQPAVKTTTETETVEANDPDLVEKSPYEIIGAAFKTLKGAKKFLQQLKEKGMHAKILKTNGKSTLITFGSYQDKETAQAALEKLHTKDPHSEAYIQHYIK